MLAVGAKNGIHPTYFQTPVYIHLIIAASGHFNVISCVTHLRSPKVALDDYFRQPDLAVGSNSETD